MSKIEVRLASARKRKDREEVKSLSKRKRKIENEFGESDKRCKRACSSLSGPLKLNSIKPRRSS